jgi:hypothetical protein
MMEAYPLHWPLGEPRTTSRVHGAFKLSFADARTELLNELRLLGARDVVISSNLPLRRDGLPLANALPTANDPGIAVYWIKDKVPLVMACDRYTSVAANLRAIGLTVEALRAIERYGSRQMRDRAFHGFAALPTNAGPIALGPNSSSNTPWREVFSDSDGHFGQHVVTREEVQKRYRLLLKRRHPDQLGGSNSRMAELNVAYEAALREID